MIEILIPTYNRSNFLVKNIRSINRLVENEGLAGKFRLLISNNSSTDDTKSGVEKIKSEVGIEIVYFEQDTNIGLERNCVFLMNNSTGDYVMFLGDDDFLPDGYLTRVCEIAQSREYGVVIPGLSLLLPDGKVEIGRKDMRTRSHSPGFSAVLDLSGHGHQLSGLFFERGDVINRYCSYPGNRNMYPFIFFIGDVMKQRPSIYLPEYQVLVSVGNSKDWNYDESGLLIDIFKNYNSLYPDNRLKRVAGCLQMIRRQPSRIRPLEPLPVFLKAFKHLFSSKDVDILLKLLLPSVFLAVRAKKMLIQSLK
jgi:abequosyltransferase